MWLIEFAALGWGRFAAALKGGVFLQYSGVGLPYFVRGSPTFVLLVKPFVVPMSISDHSMNGQILDKISVFEQRCMRL